MARIASLEADHAAAVVRRDAAVMDSPEYRAAAEEIARIESLIARLKG